MKRQKSLLLVIGGFLSVLTVNAQLCDITPNRYKACRGDYFQFLIDPSNTYASILWNFGDGDSSNQKTNTIMHTYDTFGVFTVCVTTRDATGHIKCNNCIIITISDPPNAIIGLLSPAKQLLKGNKFEFVDNLVPGTGHTPINHLYWDFGDGDSSTGPNPVHSYQAGGTYLVLLVIFDTNGCYDTATKIMTVIDSLNSITEAVKSTEFLVYPNPFTGSVNVFLPINKTVSEMALVDLSGKQILVRKNIRMNNVEIFRDELPQGIYILKIVSDKVYVFKLMAE